MRLASALVASLLFAASTALAAAPPPGQGAAAPHQERTQAVVGPADGASRGRPEAGGAPPSSDAAQRLTRTAYPAFGSGAHGADEGTEANCYYVYGDLRCDRVRVRTPR